MQGVDHCHRQAKAARELAASADSEIARSQFEKIAAMWEQLADERLAFVKLRNVLDNP